MIPIVPLLTEGRIRRAWSYVQQRGPSDCWEWQASRGTKGYGQINFRAKVLLAHRVIWTISNNREIPEGMVIYHTCDNPPCCNPAHLKLGTYQDNALDACRKGRHRGSRTDDLVMCWACKQPQPRENFHKCRRRANGLQTFCRDCDNTMRRKRWAKTKTKSAIVGSVVELASGGRRL